MLHIVVLLKFLGSYGNEVALQKLGLMLGISKGAVNDYMRRACYAILKHREQVIKWPSIEEWRNTSVRIRKAHSFVNCIGLIDGTLFPLAFAPMVNGEDIYTRKGDYAIKGLVICDVAARITWVEMGWPGSVHDNCIWVNCEIYSIWAKISILIRRSICLGNQHSRLQQWWFQPSRKAITEIWVRSRGISNNKLAKIWIKSEHCIGLLKARFQHLRGFRRVIQDKQDLDAILRQAMCTCVLHNLLINHLVPSDWFDETIEELGQDDELNQSVEQSGGDMRYNQVFAYMLEER